ALHLSVLREPPLFDYDIKRLPDKYTAPAVLPLSVPLHDMAARMGRYNELLPAVHLHAAASLRLNALPLRNNLQPVAPQTRRVKLPHIAVPLHNNFLQHTV